MHYGKDVAPPTTMVQGVITQDMGKQVTCLIHHQSAPEAFAE